MKVSTTLLVVAAVTVCAMFLLLQPAQGSPAPYEAGLRLEKLVRAPSHARLLLHFALSHDHDENHAKLRETFEAVSDPDSPRVGQYLTTKELAKLMSPREETLKRLLTWLHSHGVAQSQYHLSPWRDHLFVATRADTAEALLRHPVHLWRDTKTGYVEVAPGIDRLPEGHPMGEAVVHLITGKLSSPEERAALLAEVVEEQEQEATAAAGAGAGAAPPDIPRPYPFTFWPPSPFVAAVPVSSASYIAVVLFTCPASADTKAWPAYSVPLPPNTTLANPPQDFVWAPCGEAAGRVESFSITWSSPTSNITNSFEVAPLNATNTTLNHCKVGEFAVPVCNDTACQAPTTINQKLAGCLLEVANVTFKEHQLYNLEATMKLANHAEPLSLPLVAYPSGQRLQAIQVPNKLPSFLHEYYGVPMSPPPIGCDPKNQQGIGVLQSNVSGFYSYSDLREFYNASGIPLGAAADVHFVSVEPGNSSLSHFLKENNLTYSNYSVVNKQTDPGDETSLDVQWISGIAPGVDTTVWHGGYFDNVDNGTKSQLNPIFTVLIAVEYAKDPPMVLSLSYGLPEPSGPVLEYLESFFMGIGTVGCSSLASSGDTGAHFNFGGADGDCSAFTPSYPATSQYVTAVGASQLVLGESGKLEEVVCSIDTGAAITSGGGFSNNIDLPYWQKAVHDTYLKYAKNASAVPSKRGYPDVALFGHAFEIIQNGQPGGVDGTSASSPSFGGLVSLWNDFMLRHDQPQLGFLNPKLYKAYGEQASTFNDIVSGSNYCMGQSATNVCCDDGYDAVPGWDPVSGLGSPRFIDLGKRLLEGATWKVANCTIPNTAPTTPAFTFH